jgi:hypothetical protein
MAWKKAIEKRRELEEEARAEAIEDAKDAAKAKREAEVEAQRNGLPTTDDSKAKSDAAATTPKTDQQKAADAIKAEEKNTKPVAQPNATAGKSDKKVAPTSVPPLKKK